MLYAVPRLRPWIFGLGLLVGGKHLLYGRVAVCVDADLEPGAVPFHHHALGLFRPHGQKAAVVLAPLVRTGQVRGTRRYTPIDRYLDAAEAQAVISKAGSYSRVAQRRKVIAMHQQVHPQRQLTFLTCFLVNAKLIRRYHSVVDGGGAGFGVYIHDNPQSVAAVIVRWLGYQISLHPFRGVLVGHARQVSCGGILFQIATRRRLCIPVVPGGFQGFRVEVIDQAGTVRHKDGVFPAYSIQVCSIEEAVFRRLGIIKVEALYPFARSFLGCLLP